MRFYNDWALSILAGNWTDRYAFYGLPGYAFLLAAIYKIVGVFPIFIIFLQAILEGFVSLLILNIAILIFKKTENPYFSLSIGILAALGYAFYLPAQAFASILMPTCLLVGAFWGLIWWCLSDQERRIHWPEVLGIGVGIGVMAMTVATIFFVLPLIVIALFKKRVSKIFAISILIAGVLLGCSPAILHNRLLAHDSVVLSAHGGLNFFIGNNAQANGYLKIPPGLRANQAQMLADSISVAEYALGAKPGQKIPRSAVSDYWSSQAKAYIREHPIDWLYLLGQKIINFWNAYQYDDLSIISAFAEQGITTPGLQFGIIAALGLAGMCVLINSSYVGSRWVIAGILLHLGSLLTVFITERYRLAAVPGLVIMGAYFIVQLWENIYNSCWKCVIPQFATVIATTLFVTIPVPNQGAWALDSYNSGIRYLAMKDWANATTKLEVAWRYAPDNDNTNLAIGNLYLLQEDFHKAAVFFQHSLSINPKNTSALNNLGYIALIQNLSSPAIEYFSKTLQIEPSNLLASYQLAVSYRKNGELTEALKVIETALHLHPNQKELVELKMQLQTESSNDN